MQSPLFKISILDFKKFFDEKQGKFKISTLYFVNITNFSSILFLNVEKVPNNDLRESPEYVYKCDDQEPGQLKEIHNGVTYENKFKFYFEPLLNFQLLQNYN